MSDNFTIRVGQEFLDDFGIDESIEKFMSDPGYAQRVNLILRSTPRELLGHLVSKHRVK